MAFNKVYGYLILLLTVLNDAIPYVFTYRNLTIQNNKVCEQKFDLGESERSGLIIREFSYFNKFPTDRNLQCNFRVKTFFNFGLFAVIQNMNLRRDLHGHCLDYVQFRQVKTDIIKDMFNVDFKKILRKNNNNWGQKYCGSVSAFEAGDLEDLSTEGLSLNGFMDEEGNLEVRIFISKVEIPPRENLSLEIAFTAYQGCSQDLGANRMCGNDTCIWKNYFRDGVVNCPYLKCIDEGGCSGENIDKNLMFNLGTKVTITAVSSIFISFFLFLGCIWLCKYYELLCWGIDTVRNRNTPVEMDPMHRLTPTAPQQVTSHDKDLPPSYETLFPDR